MTTKQYKKFEKEMEVRGYKLYNRSRTVYNEHYYYCKGFCYDYRKKDPSPGYQLLFLVYDWRDVSDFAVDDYGIQPLIITSNKKYSHIDLTFLPDKINVKEIEEYAEDFYHQFVLAYETL